MKFEIPSTPHFTGACVGTVSDLQVTNPTSAAAVATFTVTSVDHTTQLFRISGNSSPALGAVPAMISMLTLFQMAGVQIGVGYTPNGSSVEAATQLVVPPIAKVDAKPGVPSKPGESYETTGTLSGVQITAPNNAWMDLTIEQKQNFVLGSNPALNVEAALLTSAYLFKSKVTLLYEVKLNGQGNEVNIVKEIRTAAS